MHKIDTYKFDSNIVGSLKDLKHYGKKIGENWPVVYILNNSEEAYIGETHQASTRLNQHLQNPVRQVLDEARIISGDSFNKSVILDLEAFLIKHMGSDGKFKLQNGNHGLQDHDYYNKNVYNEEFVSIWNQLRKDKIVNQSIIDIENSTLYKYSPYKSLGEEQLNAERQIVEAFAEHSNSDHGVSIVVRGGAGTGKTILAIYLMKLFADTNIKKEKDAALNDIEDEDSESIAAFNSIKDIKKIGIVFPQATLKASVKDIFKSVKSLNAKMVYSTTEIVDEYRKSGKKFDLLIVDEGHRLKCRYHGHLSSYAKFDECNDYLGIPKDQGNELDWLKKCSRNLIIFRDDLQTVRPCDIDGQDFKARLNDGNNAYLEIALETQWRCKGGNRYIRYVRNILSETQKEFVSFDPSAEQDAYEFKLYRDVDDMVKEIKRKDAQYGLCRNAAGYSWKWNTKNSKEGYDIEIGEYKYVWNSTYKNWIVSDNAVNEIGCIHTLQGYDLNYVGLIIGNDLKYDKAKGIIYADKDCYFDQQGKSGVANDPEALKQYLLNIYLTLMTRGIKGTYLYVCDDALREYFEQFVEVV